MPEISRFFGIIIRMYYQEEHRIPHFHAKYGAHAGVFSITELRLIEGRLQARDCLDLSGLLNIEKNY
jgi:hypothetical protein